MLIGGRGDDVLVGCYGRDEFIGGKGEDRFVLTGLGTDTIKDFEDGKDRFGLANDLRFGKLDDRAGRGGRRTPIRRRGHRSRRGRGHGPPRTGRFLRAIAG